MSMPIQISGAIAETFDLKAIAATLRAGPEYANNGRSAQTLAKAPEMNVVLTVINEDVSLKEHEAPGSVTLTVTEGKIAFISGAQQREVEAGCVVVFGPGVPHSVRGIEEAAFLLVIAKPR
jgi:quercetin dioxygenase-like cupin family protein